jgi:hypothetical protein
MTFDEFQAKKTAERAAAPPRVTWRRVSLDTGGGWSGIGPDGPSLVVRVKRSDERRLIGPGRYGYVYNIWLVRDGRTVVRSTRQIHGGTLTAAKAQAARVLANTEASRRV